MYLKEPVKLRRRKRPNGTESLYLDIYIRGRRKVESLGLYLLHVTTREGRERDRETLRLAEAICAKRIVDIRNGTWGFAPARDEVPLLTYFEEMCQRHSTHEGTYRTWTGCLHHLRTYTHGRSMLLSEVTPQWCEGFLRYLRTDAVKQQDAKHRHVTNNTVVSYYAKLRACLNSAVSDGLLEKSPAAGVKPPKISDSTRMYLTLDELRALASTPCRLEEVRRAFLFSCLTGLRSCDVYALRWGDIHDQDGYTRIIYRQRKTGAQEYTDISSQAAELLGQRGADGSTVFRRYSHDTYNHVLQEWTLRAGIGKKITFHCARHTFASMMLNLGTDIYTVSKLLGHRDLSTTQIYARIVDRTKQDAVERIPDIFGSAQQICNRKKARKTQPVQERKEGKREGRTL